MAEGGRTARRPRSDARPARRDPIGVIDIGSNSIRLVVFEGPVRAPLVLFNEKVLCELGRGLEKTGRLNPAGIRLALDNLKRFSLLARAMGTRRIITVATAAVRDAADGTEFISAIDAETGLPVRVLTGLEEARLSALGVIAGTPLADGIMGDLGGGSLELVSIDNGRPGRHTTLPCGPLRLRESAGASRESLRAAIDRHLGTLDWLERVNGRRFYAVGGAWRALARVHMEHVGYPLHVIHHYTVARSQAEEFVELISHMSLQSLQRIAEVPRKRLETLPIAALVLERLLRAGRPKELVFSALGLREGCHYDALPAAVRRLDPLLTAAEEVGRRNARFAVDGDTLVRWIEPLFEDDAANRRLRAAACWLSDIAWNEHPDHRAEIAFLRTLRMPLSGIDHAGRAFLALALITRYAGAPKAEIARPAVILLDEERRRAACRLGLALRLAYTLSGGAPSMLRRSSLALQGNQLRLIVPDSERPFFGEAVDRRFEALARAFDRKPVMKAQ